MRHVRVLASFLVCVLTVAAGRDASGECLLANPSFEVTGSGGAVFGGWNQFGSVGSSSGGTHGFRAARVSGPNTGGWDVSGYWQRIDTVPGDRWAAAVSGWHTAVRPLTGGSRAILNIEWRDAAGNLISYESHTVASPATPVGEVQRVSVESGAAPAGTVAAHFLLGVLQGPTDPVPDVYFDEATFEKLGPPSLDDIQWNDFPGGRTLSFGGRTWRVKGPGYYDPGPSQFSDSPTAVWVDGDGRLHLTIRKVGSFWYSTEVALEEAPGYGDYVFTTRGRIDLLDVKTVLGLFIWQYNRCWDPARLWWNPNNEIDVELSRWGTPGNAVAQFVAQPFDYPGNRRRFDITYSPDELVSYAFHWLHDRVEFRSWRGGPFDESPATLLQSWIYTGPHIPRPEQPRVHINFWQFNGAPATNQEVVLDTFVFVPEGVVAVGEEPLPGRNMSLLPARPNPFRSGTRLTFRMERRERAGISIYDLAGRLVRTLLSAEMGEGSHEVAWDGCDGSGRAVPSGVYLVQLRSGREVETLRVVRVK